MPLFRGSLGPDNLRGSAGRDTILGLDGNDTIAPGRGGDWVHAGPGADMVYWTRDIWTRGVVDTYIGGSWQEAYDPDPYFARTGGDRLVIGAQPAPGAFRVTYLSTEDGFVLDSRGNRLNFSEFERLRTGAGHDVIDASRAVIEPPRGVPGDAQNHVPVHGIDIVSGAGNDRIFGSQAADVIDGGAGNDTIRAGGGWDFIQSSTGNDLIYGGGGNDNIRWGQGNPDEQVGHDTIFGGEANERGGDLLNIWIKDWDGTGVRVNFITNESGTASTMIGGGLSTLRFHEFENFFTHEGNDTVSAAQAPPGEGNRGIQFNTRWGNDLLTGSRGDDTLEGGQGADTLDGRGGDDVISLVEDAWRDIGDPVQPDAQRDMVIMRDDSGFDTLRGFQVGDLRDAQGTVIRRGDVLNLNGLHDRHGNPVDVSDVRVSQRDGHALLTFSNGERLLLEGVRADGLTRARLLEMGFQRPDAQVAARVAALGQPQAPSRAELTGAAPDLRADAPQAQAMAARQEQPAKDGGPDQVPCFCAGTLIDTPRGAVPVQDLRPGDAVLTLDGGPLPLHWVGRRMLGPERLAAQPELRPIRIAAGALGPGIPATDLSVSPQHRILVRSAIAQRMFGAREVLVAARQLLALPGIAVQDLPQVDYVHILFRGHQIVFSNGAPTESLYPGAEAMKSVGAAARAEILAIFPELRDQTAEPARILVRGGRARHLAQRHLRNAKPLVLRG